MASTAPFYHVLRQARLSPSSSSLSTRKLNPKSFLCPLSTLFFSSSSDSPPHIPSLPPEPHDSEAHGSRTTSSECQSPSPPSNEQCPPSEQPQGPSEDSFSYSYFKARGGETGRPEDDIIPVVSYPLADDVDSDPNERFSGYGSYQSGVIPPVYEPFSKRHVAPLPEDRTFESDSSQTFPGEPGTFYQHEHLDHEGTQADSRRTFGYDRAWSARSGQAARQWPMPEDEQQNQLEYYPKPGELQFTPEAEIEIPLPKIVKDETKKRLDPMVLIEAIRKVKASAKSRFDETVEAHVRLGVDPKRSDQLVRGAATLPHGSGKVIRVAVLAEGEDADEARAAGAEVVGSDDLIDMIMQSGGKLDFDKCIATPAMMPKLTKVGRILGPRGLMPNPKVGTVTKNVGNAVKHVKQGRVDFRADKTGIVHVGLGKASFSEEALRDNIAAFANALLAAKPLGLKKTSKYAGYMNGFALCSTMGPSVRVTIQSISHAVDSYKSSLE